MAKKNKNEITIRSSAAEYLTYVASVGGEESSVEMRYEDENIWLTQKMMAVLYDVSVSAINQHLKRIFDDGELIESSVIKKYLITANDGKNYNTNHYNLQAIIAVGFKVNNDRAVQFRKWAGQFQTRSKNKTANSRMRSDGLYLFRITYRRKFQKRGN